MQSFNIHIYSEPIKVRDLCVLHCQLEVHNSNNNDTNNNNNTNKNDTSDHETPKNTIDANERELLALPPFLDIGRKLLTTKEDNEKYGAFGISLISEND
jgi:hypothetical protein